ncbi:hypothetical protein EDB84DRAFT_1569548 [Lactarius hengduanensis]|nr:hypothetical protein EDB84DRAFT_1569548 [Lactarius hengduanensis]
MRNDSVGEAYSEQYIIEQAQRNSPIFQSLGKATKYTRPNVKKFGLPTNQKISKLRPQPPRCTSQSTLHPHQLQGSSGVEATYTASSGLSESPPAPCPSGPNVTPTPVRGSSATQAIYIPSSPVLGPSDPSDDPPRLQCHVLPGPRVPLPSQALDPSVLLVLLDCVGNWSVPSLWNVLRLMDTHHPAVGPSYADLHEELVELGIEDTVDLYSLPIELLATFGWLRQDSARRLLEFCRDRFLFPLGFLEEGSIVGVGSVTASDSPLTNMGVSDSEEGQSIREERDDEMILEWLDGVDTDEEDEEDDDEAGGGHGYRATS